MEEVRTSLEEVKTTNNSTQIAIKRATPQRAQPQFTNPK